MNQFTNISFGEGKRQQLCKSFGASDVNKSNVIEKGNKLNTSHLVLKEVNINGKTHHRWVNPNKGDAEHASHGSEVEFEHKGQKIKGKVGAVLKTGEYAIKGSDGKTYNKHPHQFDSPHKDDGVDEGKHVAPESSKKSHEDWAEGTDTKVLQNYIAKKDADPKALAAAQKELEKREESGEDGEKGGAKKKDGEGKEGGEEKTDGKKVDEKEVKKLDEEADEEVDINKKFKTYEKFVRMVAKGQAKSAIAYGTGGVGKTYTAEATLEKTINPKTGEPYRAFDEDSHEVGSEDYDYVKITGKASTAGVYRTMYEHNGKLLLFDDCDSVLKDENTINMFKGALDSTGDGTISNNTAAPIKDGNGEPIPQRYKFKGRAIFISNLPPDKMPQPLKSRALRVDLSMDAKQTIDRIKAISSSKDGKLTNIKLKDVDGNVIKYDHEDMEAAINFLDKHKEKTTDLNVRTLGNIVRIIHDGKEEGEDEGEWEDTAKHFLFSKGELNYGIEKSFADIMNFDPVDLAFEKAMGEEAPGQTNQWGLGGIHKSKDKKKDEEEDESDEVEKAFSNLLEF